MPQPNKTPYTTHKLTLAIAAVITTSILVVGCSGSKSSDDAQAATNNNSPTPTTQTAPPAPQEEADAYDLAEIVVTAAKRGRFSDSAVQSEAVMAAPQIAYDQLYYQEENRENYTHREQNSFIQVEDNSVSTFSIDVDTASYANLRRMLRGGALPPADAVRVEEMINYFDYNYPQPESSEQPFTLTTEISASPWAEGRHLVHIGLQGKDIDFANLPAANLVFLLDVSGSMNSPDKLPLLKKSLQLLAKQLRPQDRVSIVVYAGASGLVLKPTPGNDQSTIERALDQLSAGGSTNGGAGIELAYKTAQQSFAKGGINRVILATDGDFNVGTTDLDQLKSLIKRQRDSGIELTTLGFGTGNYNDALMNELAELGNGNAAYIDTALEARKALVEELAGTFYTLAKDVKLQIEFSPAVKEYRLIGYESRALNREDFNNDKKDAGELGAGHTVTALYEIVLADSNAGTVDPLRYEKKSEMSFTNELAFLKLRYKPIGSHTSTLIEQPLLKSAIKPIADSSENFRWSAAVAAFGQQLNGSDWIGRYSYDNTLALAQSSRGSDPQGYRAEMIQLVKMARDLKQQTHASRE